MLKLRNLIKITKVHKASNYDLWWRFKAELILSPAISARMLFSRRLRNNTFRLEMARSKIFQARTAHSPQHPAHNRPWTEDIYSFSNRPAHGPLNNWQIQLILPPEAKYLSWLFCVPRQNICWDYFAFCGTWLVEVVMWCEKHSIQSYVLWLVWT